MSPAHSTDRPGPWQICSTI